MSEQAAAVDQEVTSSLGMSDEEFANLDPSDYPGAEPEVTEEPVDQDLESAESESDEDQDADVATEEDADDEGESDEAGSDTEEDDDSDDSESDEDGDTEDGDTEDESGEDETDGEEDKDKEKSDIDYKAEYEKLLAPFRANGKDMTVENIDDARQLMQMGANYNKKMAALKPSLKTLKLLENNDLMGEENLSYLIDLHKGNPEAIKKLVKDHGIDPLDMDVESDSDYKPETYTVDEREMALDEVLESIQDTPTYTETVDVVSNKWDRNSKQAVYNNPQLLEVINDHMANGIYGRISSAVEKERTLGRLNGLSDLDAYYQVGDKMNAEGAFNDLVAGKQQDKTPEKQTVAPPKAKGKSADPKLKDKKRAASSTKAKTAAPAPDYNPLGMSDEEFDKQFNTNLM